jgi:hypothetical protein
LHKIFSKLENEPKLVTPAFDEGCSENRPGIKKFLFGTNPNLITPVRLDG